MKMIGTVVVSLCAAKVAGSPFASRTSARGLTPARWRTAPNRRHPRPIQFDLKISANCPASFLEFAPERCRAQLTLRIVFGVQDDDTDPPYLFPLLRTSRDRPRTAAPPSPAMNSRRFKYPSKGNPSTPQT